VNATPIRRGERDGDLIGFRLRREPVRFVRERTRREPDRERDEAPPLPAVLRRGATRLPYGSSVPVNSPVAVAKPGSDRVSGLLARRGAASLSPMPCTSATMYPNSAESTIPSSSRA
jgi:hypothetical protein